MPSTREQNTSGPRRFFKRLFRSNRSRGDEPGRWNKNLINSLSKTRLPSWRQIRHLPEVLSTNDSLRLQLGSFLLIVGLGIVGAAFWYARTAVVPADGGTLTEGVVGALRSLNPVLAVSNDADADIARLVYSRLYTTSGDGTTVPDLVESQQVSDDRTVYTLTIRDGVRWHDGQPLTVDDILFTFQLIQDPAWKSPLNAAFRDVVAEKAGDRSIKLTLKEPYAPFLSELTFGILPKHVWKDIDPQNVLQADANLKPIGSGPFMFEDFSRDKRGFVMTYSLKRNKDWYQRPPYLDSIVFRFYPDFQTAIAGLQRREIESLSYVPRDLRSSLKGIGGVVPMELDLPQETAVFFNPRHSDILNSKDVRTALTMAINKNRILLDALEGDGRPLDGPVIPGYTDTLGTTIPFNPDGAKKTLDAAGWKLGQDGIRTKGDKPLQLTLTAVDSPESLTVARIIKDGWTALGVDVVLDAVPAGDIARTAIKPRAYDALLYGQLLGADGDPYPFWHSSQITDPGLNLAMFADRAADDALEAARKAEDPETRQTQYAKFEQVVRDDVPAAFLYSPSYTYPIPSVLKGFAGVRVTNPSDRFSTVTDWYLKTKRAWK